MKIFDDFLQEEVDIQEEITPENGKEIKIEDPEGFEFVVEDKEQ